MLKTLKKNKGITLIALVITVIVMLILAGVAISALTGANGLLSQALGAGQKYNEASQNEAETLQSLLNELNNYASGNAPTKPDYTDGVANTPKLGEGFIPVKHNGTNWVVADTKSEWYNYSDTKKEWANAVLVSDTNRANYYNDGDIKVNNYKAGTTVLESDVLCYLVWIPRYKYYINTTNYHTSTAGLINVAFENGTGTTGTGAGNGTDDSAYLTHPVFTNSPNNGGWDSELTGFWVGKFESSRSDATPITAGQTTAPNAGNAATKTIAIQPNVTSWRNITVNDIFNRCLEMNDTSNIYGIASTTDTHMMKNTEWGAVAYLAHSKYGQGTTEITINNNQNYVTGIAGDTVSAAGSTATTNTYTTTNGQKASTTGNIYGIYDMSGGAWEYVAGYLGNGGSYSASLVNETNMRYKNVYTTYDATIKGDAVYETSNSSSGSTSWNGDYSGFPGSSYPVFLRGGYFSDGTSAGTFDFNGLSGNANSFDGFRVALAL